MYPYVFLNEEPFTDEFNKRVSVLTNSKMEFGVIPRDHWFQPDWIDEERATAGRKKLEEENVMRFCLMHAFGRNRRVVVDDK
ncbi:glycosyltransferase family 15 protein [Amanita muscaria Koide BX008]|uniref:Glycosyltransferase family 15 protein n=1 Tax=Amanita muscaria (strain Koide BX008) TaxID=946122 RepID=A0A0C2W9I8_AMAMK|nr:glycosyltransferase family 15 protein [Amanita muscaria Koide BX008]